MGHLFTRQQLYELVWSEPMTTLAKSLAISGVGLAKACRRGDIPVPPRGYWARLNAGQRVARTPLPRRAPGASDGVAVGAGRPQTFQPEGDENNPGNEGDHDDDSVQQAELPPAPPVYDETLDEVEARIRHVLPAKFRFMRAPHNVHPQIARLLREDDERREAMTKSRTFDKPRFESRFEQRRLAFLSNLFVLLGRLEVQGSVRGRDARELSAHVGDQYVKFKVELLATLRPRTRPPGTKSEPMAIEVEVARWQHGEREERLFWSDSEESRLEDQLQEIGVAIVLTGERQYRKALKFSYDWDKHSFEERIEKARKAREEAKQREREQSLQAEQDRVARLLAQVSARQQAQQIRAYVDAVLSSPDAIAGRAFDGDRDTWASWAHSIADQLDPLAPAGSPDTASQDQSANHAGSMTRDTRPPATGVIMTAACLLRPDNVIETCKTGVGPRASGS